MKLTYTCSLVSRGFRLVDQAVGYDMQDAARRFLTDGMGALAAQRFDIGIVDGLQRIPEAHSLDPFILSGGVDTQQPWSLTVTLEGDEDQVNVLVHQTDSGDLLLYSDGRVNLYHLKVGDDNWDAESDPQSCVMLERQEFFVARAVCGPSDIKRQLQALAHVAATN
jgi:hypothetical protein